MSDNKPSSKKSKLVPLFVTFAILFIFVFVLGIIIGKGLGGPEAPVVETTYEIGVPDEELDTEIDEEEVVQETVTAEVEQPAAKIKPEDIVTEKDPTPKEKKPEAKKDESIKAEDKVDGTYHIETRSKPTKSADKPTKPEAGSTDDVIKDLKEGSAKKASSEKSKVAKATMPKTDPGGRYTVQLAAFQNQAQASSLMNSLKSKGYPAFIKQYQSADKKTWYRVRVGTFATKEKAAEYGEKLKKQQPEVKSVFITSNL